MTTLRTARERAYGQVWEIHHVQLGAGSQPVVVRLGERHHTDKGWNCDNVKNSLFLWINDTYWTTPKKYRLVLVSR